MSNNFSDNLFVKVNVKMLLSVKGDVPPPVHPYADVTLVSIFFSEQKTRVVFIILDVGCKQTTPNKQYMLKYYSPGFLGKWTKRVQRRGDSAELRGQ